MTEWIVLPDLLVGEAVVGRRALRVLVQQAGRDGRSQRLGHVVVARIRIRVAEASLHRLEVLEAEAPSQHGRLGQGGLGLLGKPSRPTLD